MGERKVFSEIVEAEGEILQKDLPIQTGFSKAKITRILNSLEMKVLIIRKSYGMTNKGKNRVTCIPRPAVERSCVYAEVSAKLVDAVAFAGYWRRDF